VPGLDAVVDGVPLEPLVELASMHGVTNAAYLSLRSCPEAEPTAVETLRRRYQKGVARSLRASAELRALVETLADASVPWLVVKGPVVAEDLYGRRDLRSWGDIDLLTAPGDFERLVEALGDHGARLLDADWRTICSEHRSQLHFELPLGGVADVHWHLLNRRFVRASFPMATDELMARAVWTSVGGVPVRTLDREDTLLHLSLHGAMSGGNRLRWLKDVERAVAGGPAWDTVVDRAMSWRACRPVGLMLHRARQVLGADVPAAVGRELLPRSLRGVDDHFLRRWWPLEGVPRGHRHVTTLVPRSLRDDVRGSAIAASRRAVEGAVRRPGAGSPATGPSVRTYLEMLPSATDRV